MIRVAELFDAVSIRAEGPKPWRTPIKSSAPGVYVLSARLTDVSTFKRLDENELGLWNADEKVVYIGKSNNLGKRLGQFYRHVFGNRKPHRGGQSVLLLDAALEVHWGVTADCASAELQMLKYFSSRVGALPYANRRWPSGG